MTEAYSYAFTHTRTHTRERSLIDVPPGWQEVVARKKADVISTRGLFSCVGLAGISRDLDIAFVGHYFDRCDIEEAFRVLQEEITSLFPRDRRFRVALAGGERERNGSERVCFKLGELLDNDSGFGLKFEVVEDHSLRYREDDIPDSGVSLGVEFSSGRFFTNLD